MIVRKTLSVKNSVHKASIEVELDSLEMSYIQAHGEPKVDLAGIIPFTPSTPSTPSGALSFDIEGDIGSVPEAGSSSFNDGLDAYELNGSGTFPTARTSHPGFFKAKQEVIGDFRLRARLDHASGHLADPSASDGFLIGLGIFLDDAAGAPGAILGWGGHNSALGINLWQRTVLDAAFSTINSVARTSPNGIYFEVVRDSDSLTFKYSTDNGDSWATIGTITITQQTLRVGLFINSGVATTAFAILSNVELVSLPTEEVNSFTILNGPDLVLLRSQSPHEFQLDGKTDGEAEAKVEGWSEEIEDRLKAAKDTLLTKANPTLTDQTSIKQF